MDHSTTVLSLFLYGTCSVREDTQTLYYPLWINTAALFVIFTKGTDRQRFIYDYLRKWLGKNLGSRSATTTVLVQLLKTSYGIFKQSDL